MRLPVFPSTKSTVIVVRSKGRGVGVNEKSTELKFAATFRQNRHARAPGGAQFHGEGRLKNLFEQFPLINAGGRPDAQAAAALHQHDLIRVFRREI